MIRSYKYLDTAVQLKLQKLIITFFNRIENENGVFDEDFFGEELLEVADRHPQILKQQCIDIYNIIRTWNQQDRSNLCLQIRASNNIENICQGKYLPPTINRYATGVNKLLRDLFLNLYNQVLDGNGFNEIYHTTLRTHFDDFSRLNGDITLCPICGIGDLRKHTDLTRDQYDHYLPKSIYPFSSINFKNLVPICIDCNSPQVKGSKDVVALSNNHKLFFLYDDKHKGISINFQITADAINPEYIQWQITYHNPDDKIDEIETWKKVYNIDDRYKGYVNARIEKWFRHYWDYKVKSKIAHLTNEIKWLCYDAFLEGDEEHYLNFIRRPALSGFLKGSTLAQAAIEAKHYSIPATA